MTVAAHEVLARIARELSIPASSVPTAEALPAVSLPSRLSTGDLAAASATACAIAAGIDPSLIDGFRVATAYRSDRVLTVDGVAPTIWSPYSGFWATADGWIRTHGNYRHHAEALRRGLRLTAGADPSAIGGVLTDMTSATAVARIVAAGGLAVSVDREAPEVDARLRVQPLLDVRRGDDAVTAPRTDEPIAHGGHAPLTGVRVLDLTRVIAGPVATRTLALLGADVLRIDPPTMAELGWQHLDTGHGKRTAVLDARSPRMLELIDAADVVVLGYRPAAIARLGLSPATLLARNPRLIVAQLSAWGEDRPDSAGFDSLVQASSGIAWVESPDGIRPSTLPAQALDHSAGYLLAAAITTLLRRGGSDGRSWLVRTSLRRIAAELLGMPRHTEPGSPGSTGAPEDHIARFAVDGEIVTTARPILPGLEFAAPHRWGSDQPRW